MCQELKLHICLNYNNTFGQKHQIWVGYNVNQANLFRFASFQHLTELACKDLFNLAECRTAKRSSLWSNNFSSLTSSTSSNKCIHLGQCLQGFWRCLFKKMQATNFDQNQAYSDMVLALSSTTCLLLLLLYKYQLQQFKNNQSLYC